MQQINTLRKQLGLTISGFAAEYGISFSYSEKLMYGVKKPSAMLLKKIKSKNPSVDMNIFLVENSTESGDAPPAEQHEQAI